MTCELGVLSFRRSSPRGALVLLGTFSLVLATTLALTLAITLAPRDASAQIPVDVRFHVPFSFSNSAGSESTRVLLDHLVPISGWSFGLCHDPTDLTVQSAVEGAELAAFNGGAGPDFHEIFIDPDGVRSYVVTGVSAAMPLPPGMAMEVLEIVYLPLTMAQSATVEFCETLGTPPVQNLAVMEQTGIVPTLEAGTVITTTASPLFVFRIPPSVSTYDLTTGNAEFTIEPTIHEVTATGIPTYAFRLGIRHEGSLFAAPFIESIDPIAALSQGQGADLFMATLFPDGITLEVVYDQMPPFAETLAFPTETTIASIRYFTVTGSLQGVGTPVLSPITFDDTFMSQGQTVVGGVVTDLAAPPMVPIQIDGSVILFPIGIFIRGDCNTDGAVDIADPLRVLNELFLGAISECERACDANDDAMKDISDAIHLLQGLFTGGPPPAAPSPDCGLDPTPDTLTCDSFPPC